MFLKFLFINLFFTALLFSNESEVKSIINLDSLKIIQLSEWEFSPEGYTDSSWQTISLPAFQHQDKGIIWLRKHIHFTGQMDDSDLLALAFYNIPEAFEVYWDGEKISENGTIDSNPSGNTPGKVRHLVRLGKSKTQAGRHIVALRISNIHLKNEDIFSKIMLGYYSKLISMIQTDLDKRILQAGLHFIATLIFISLFLGGWKHYSFLFFSAYTFFYFLWCIWIYSIEASMVSTAVFNWLEPLFIKGFPVTFVILNLFFIWHFEIPKKLMHAAVMFGIVLIANQIPTGNIWLNIFINETILSCYALGLIIYRLKDKMPGTAAAFSGMLLMVLYNFYILHLIYFNPAQGWPYLLQFFTGLLFISSIIIAITRKIQDQHRRYHKIKLRSQRLETELLKKSIQPHFIMNTLLSIKSWLSKDSRTAEKLIEALSNEFQIINGIASKKEILLKEEIELCRYHLDVMGFRREAAYQLITKFDTDSEKIPPMIFHTLIENGLTHAYQPKENGTFNLLCSKNNDGTEFQLTNDGSRLHDFIKMPPEKIEEGMGFKYVKARLEENYPGNWQMTYGLKNGSWEVKIIIKDKRLQNKQNTPPLTA